MDFADLVSEKTVLDAGFNYHQMSLGIQKPDDKCYAVYLGQIGARQLNIVVIEGPKKEWYFGTFYGNHPGQCATTEEANKVIEKIEGFLENQVPGEELEALIKKEVDKYFS